jgi:hypothetical protein
LRSCKRNSTLRQSRSPKAAKPARGLDDRIIVAPGTLDDVRAMTDGSKRHLLAQALERGATVDHLMAVTGWRKDSVTAALRLDIPACGLGVERRGGRYFLLKPAGLKRLPVKTRDVTRAAALVAACK